MKRDKIPVRITVVCLAGILLLGGCGSNGDSSGADRVDGSSGSTSGETWQEADTAENGPAEDKVDSAENDAAQEGELQSAEKADEAEGPMGALPREEAGTADDNGAADSTGGTYDSISEKSMEKQNYLESCYSYDWPKETYSSEEYSQWDEKGYVSVMKEPLSTFAADVDTASYSNLRRMIRDGYDLESIPEGAARIEEMVNYFSYDYKGPEGEEPFGVTTQISQCPWNTEAELLMIGLKTEDIDYSQAPPSNLVFLLDVSGSMDSYDKLPLQQESFGLLAENLTNKDRISIVTYAADTRTVLDGARGNETRKILHALNSLEAGGGTYGSKGIETAYALAQRNFIQGGNNRVILATDGDLNIGMTTEEELEDLITAKKESGIFLSVLGFGTGNIKDNKMETLADKGNGNYAYIDGLREANKVLAEELSATLLTICKDVKFQVEFNPAVVKSYRLLGYENRALDKEDFQDDTKDAGEIGAGHCVTVLYELTLKDGMNPGMSGKEIKDLKYSKEYEQELGRPITESTAYKEWLTVSVRYKKPAEKTSSLLEYPVGYESYTTAPTEDFVFAAAVAEFGLLASHSQYPEDASLYHVDKTLRSIKLKDEYREEFQELVGMVYRNYR
jgi:Ca-activated chloride channel family protein